MSEALPVDNSESYDSILSKLYAEYYSASSNHSEVTSSHWRQVGSCAVKAKGGRYIVSGAGFGAFRTRNLLQWVVSIPERILLSRLLRKHNCPDCLFEAGKAIAKRSGHLPAFDHIKQILSIHTILKVLGGGLSFTAQGISRICVIGDGYGFLSGFLKEIDPSIKVLVVNLGRTLFFDVLYLKRCFPAEKAVLLNEKNKEQLESSQGISFLQAEDYSCLKNLNIDLYINIASMQEMDPVVTDRYFEYMRTSRADPCWLYCCNREEKQLPDGTMTRFADYDWGNCEVFLDELCPWYQKYPASIPPFWRPFDGLFRHRIVRIR